MDIIHHPSLRLKQRASASFPFNLCRHSGKSWQKAFSPDGAWGDFWPVLIKDLQLFDTGVQGLGVVFGNVKLIVGRVKGKCLCEGRVNELTDLFRIIHHLGKHKFNKRSKILPESGEVHLKPWKSRRNS